MILKQFKALFDYDFTSMEEDLKELIVLNSYQIIRQLENLN